MVFRKQIEGIENAKMAGAVPKISIIAACYNADKFIRETIEGIILKRLFDLQYIIVDGNSNDSTQNIIEEYITIFKKIRTS